MSGLTLTLREAPPARLDLAGVSFGPALLKLPLGGGALGDIATLSGHDAADLRIVGDAARLDGLGAGMTAGRLIVEGNCGDRLGEAMSGGSIEVRGSVGRFAGSGATAGRIVIAGEAGAGAGAATPAGRYGLAGATMVVRGGVGDGAGAGMRRGLLIVHGAAGAEAAARMLAGTMLVAGDCGPRPASLMRRGTLICGGSVTPGETFADGGLQALVALRLLARFAAADLPAGLAARLDRPARRYSGDMAALGKGEILTLM